MRVSEIFFSIQGEGIQIGLPTVFLRLFGCDLRCRWCDTMYAVEGTDFQNMEIEQILHKFSDYDSKRICITGGEPLLQETQLITLSDNLLNLGYEIILETSGHRTPPEIFWNDKCVISMDCKCPSSGMQDRMDFELFQKLRTTDQLKFVLSDENDYDYAKKVLDDNNIRANIIFQPVHGSSDKWIYERVLREKVKNVRVLPQLHKLIWGEKRGV